MRIRTLGSVVVLAFALMSTAAWACPGEGGCAKNCKKGATKAADKTADKDAKGGCKGHKNAQKAADAKGGCEKKCHKGAKTVADKDGKAKKGCCGKAKGAKTVADKKGGCSKKCGSHAKTVADKKGGCSKKCGTSAKTVADKGQQCPIGKKVDAILTSLPSMKYKIGDDVTCCSKSAKAMSDESKKPVRFVVGDATFEDQGEAAVVLTKMLDEQLGEMQSVQFSVNGKCSNCPTTAKKMAKKAKAKVAYRVAGFDFDDKEQADKVAKLVADAIDKTQVSYKVDGKSYHCDKMAGKKCKASGKKMTYVVGETETCCDKEAKILLTEARIRTAVETAADAFRS